MAQILWPNMPVAALIADLTHALGLVSERAHLVLEEVGRSDIFCGRIDLNHGATPLTMRQARMGRRIDLRCIIAERAQSMM